MPSGNYHYSIHPGTRLPTAHQSKKMRCQPSNNKQLTLLPSNREDNEFFRLS
jgi:hypothetical protein